MEAYFVEAVAYASIGYSYSRKRSSFLVELAAGFEAGAGFGVGRDINVAGASSVG
jgi:hypothetical protein